MGKQIHWRWGLVGSAIAVLKGSLFTYLACLFYPTPLRGWFWFFAVYAALMWLAMLQGILLTVRLRRRHSETMELRSRD